MKKKEFLLWSKFHFGCALSVDDFLAASASLSFHALKIRQVPVTILVQHCGQTRVFQVGSHTPLWLIVVNSRFPHTSNQSSIDTSSVSLLFLSHCERTRNERWFEEELRLLGVTLPIFECKKEGDICEDSLLSPPCVVFFNTTRLILILFNFLVVVVLENWFNGRQKSSRLRKTPNTKKSHSHISPPIGQVNTHATVVLFGTFATKNLTPGFSLSWFKHDPSYEWRI